VAQPGLLTAR